MILERIEIRDLPGIDERFDVPCRAGLNVVAGANAAGKTSLARAVLDVLLESRTFRGEVRLVASSGADQLFASRRTGEPTRFEDGRRPALPEQRFRECFHLELRDLLATGPREELVAKIREELDRGLRLDAPLREERALSGKSRSVSDRARELRAAEQRRHEVESAHARLDAERESLEDLDCRRRAASQAARDKQHVERAIELAGARSELAGIAAELEAFPPAMESLQAGDLAALQSLRKRLTEQCEALSAAGAAETGAAEAIRATGFPSAPPSDEELAHFGALVAELGRLEQRLQEARRELSKAEAALGQASAGLGPSAEASPPAPDTLAALERWLVIAIDQRSHLAAKRARLGELDAQLAAQAPGLSTAWWTSRKLLAGLFLAAAGSVLLWLETARPIAPEGSWSSLALVAAAQLAIAAGGMFAGVALAGRMRMEGAESERLLASRQEVARGGAELERETAEAAERRREWLLAAGLDPDLGALPALDIARRLDAVRGERAEASAARAAEDAFRSELSAGLRTISELLSRFEAPGDPSSSIEAAASRVERLRSRVRALAQGRTELENASKAAAATERELARLNAELSEFNQRLKLPEDSELELRGRIERLPRWNELVEARRRAYASVASCEQALRDRPELLNLGEQDARERLERCEALEASHDELTSRISDVRSALARAEADHDLESALAAEADCRERLRELRDRAVLGRAAEFLLAGVASEHRRTVRSGIIPRARALFDRFTCREYELELVDRDSAGGIEIRVRDHRRRAFDLEQLSGGTRVQLLLALQLAIAEQVERGERLPIFVDEALATSDPDRGDAIARALCELALDPQRQVFVLTASAEDRRRLLEAAVAAGAPAPHCIDLDDLRGRARALAAPEDVRLERRPAVPEPGELSAEEYLVRIGAWPVDLQHPADALHVGHLFRDDLVRLRTLVGEGLEQLGKLRKWAGEPGHDALGAALAREVEVRGAVAEAYLDLRRRGRVPPMTREDLLEAGLEGSKLRDVVLDLAEWCGWDGVRLVRELEVGERRPRGWHAKMTAKIRDSLAERGLFTDEVPLQPGEILDGVYARCKGLMEAGRLTRERVRELCDMLGAGIQLKLG